MDLLNNLSIFCLQAGKSLSILGLHGSQREAHQLPELAPVRVSHSLPIVGISLERMFIPFATSRNRLRH